MTSAAANDAHSQALLAGEECRLAAQRYAALGLSVTVLCPPNHVGVGKEHAKNCGSPGKAPWHTWKECQEPEGRLTSQKINELFRHNPQSNVGAAMGPSSGLVRVDVDGPEGEQRLQELSRGDLPDTWEFVSGRPNGGRGLLYRIPAGAVIKTTIVKPDEPKTELRFQAKGAQTVLPPSRHPAGGRYQWVDGRAPDDIDCAMMPPWLIEQLKVAPERNGHTFRGKATDGDRGAIVKRAAAYVAKMPAAVSGQGGHNATFRVACVLILGFALTIDEALPVLEEFNRRCEPPWSDKDLLHKLEDADKQDGERGYLLEGGDIHRTDLGNAKRVVQRHGQDLRYCHPWKQWAIWDGRRWRQDDTAEIVRRVKETQRSLYRSTAAEISRFDAGDDDKERQGELAKLVSLLKHCLSWEAAKKIGYCIDLMRSEPCIPILPDQLDRDRFALNVLNGTLDLRTGELRSHRREDCLTQLAPVEYDPDAEAPLWAKFLGRIMDGKGDLVAYLQRMMGYCLTGDVSEQALWFFYGCGANGKTTLLKVMLSVLGDYAKQSVSELLMARNHEAHPTERADLFGCRMVAVTETEEGKRLAESLVKQLTGGDKVRARKMKQDFFEFDPTHKIILGANHKPVIRGQDFAIWRRIKLVPFTVTIPDDERDRDLGRKLEAELPGILAWAVRGCLDWQQKGMNEPEEVKAATEAYKSEQDSLARFIAEACFVHPEAKAQASVFFAAYQEWSGDRWTSQKAFTAMMRDRGFESTPGHAGRTFYRGIGLPAEGVQDDGF